jgi:hypothetical protein
VYLTGVVPLPLLEEAPVNGPEPPPQPASASVAVATTSIDTSFFMLLSTLNAARDGPIHHFSRH